MFLGFDLYSGKYAMTPQYVFSPPLQTVTLGDGRYDRLYLSSDYTKTADNLNDEWDNSVKIDVQFANGLDGGNTGFTIQNTDVIVLKIRESGTLDWITIFEIPIEEMTDFNFVREYYYAKADMDYDIMVLSTMDGTANSYQMVSCYSVFTGMCIADKDTFYHTMFNLDAVDTVRNTSNLAMTLLNSKYPVVVTNDDSCYDSGTVTCVFLLMDENEVVTERTQATLYRSEILTWLSNNRAKILKTFNGKRWMVRVIDSVSETQDGHPELQQISFGFIEIGDCYSESELYNNDLSDVEPNKW